MIDFIVSIDERRVELDDRQAWRSYYSLLTILFLVFCCQLARIAT